MSALWEALARVRGWDRALVIFFVVMAAWWLVFPPRNVGMAILDLLVAWLIAENAILKSINRSLAASAKDVLETAQAILRDYE